MADPVKVKKYLGDLEDARKVGRAVDPPPFFSLQNLFGGQTGAFNEAVKQQGDLMKPAAPTPARTAFTDAEEEEQRVKKIQQRRQ